jgi:photosystem II stability/assembly factor-like uncharacterized protein
LRRSIWRAIVVGTSILALGLVGTLFAAPDAFKDPLDTVAPRVVRQLVSTPMNAVVRAGDRLVAVGIHGLIVFSDDAGKTWTQAAVPVASDLLDLSFPTPKDGWAVGHDGIVLHTRDGGGSWEKQLDGRVTGRQLTEHFEAQVKAGQEDAQRYLQDTQMNYTGGPGQALLSVWFKDAQRGFIAGSFGTLLVTNDGGATWESWVERVNVSMPVHYYSIRGTRYGVMMASEKGMVFRLDEAKRRFVQMPTGYAGTFFNLLETKDGVLALGLRGTMYRLAGSAARWEKADSGVTAAFTGGTELSDGRALLVTQSGQLVTTQGDGEHFRHIPVARPMLFTGVAEAGGNLAVVVGSDGVRQVALQ